MIKHIALVLVIFALSFSLMFFFTDKTEYQTVSHSAKEPRIYVTKYGTRYHASECRYLRQSKIEKGLYDAKSDGYSACSYCEGIPCGTVEVRYYTTEAKTITKEVAIRSVLFACCTAVAYISVCVIQSKKKRSSKRNR